MAVTSVLNIHPKAGRSGEILESLRQIRGAAEKAGATTRLLRPAIGGDTGALSLSMTVDDWEAFGQLAQKMQSNAEVQKIFQRGRENRDPGAESGTSTVFSDVD